MASRMQRSRKALPRALAVRGAIDQSPARKRARTSDRHTSRGCRPDAAPTCKVPARSTTRADRHRTGSRTCSVLPFRVEASCPARAVVGGELPASPSRSLRIRGRWHPLLVSCLSESPQPSSIWCGPHGKCGSGSPSCSSTRCRAQGRGRDCDGASRHSPMIGNRSRGTELGQPTARSPTPAL